MMKKKKQSRSQSSTKKTYEPSPDSSPSPSPRLLSIIRSKLVSGKDLKHMFRGMKTKTTPGLSSQSRIVRCPKCHKLLQEPIDATIYKCSGCNSILQAKRWDLESNGDSIPEALLYSQNRSLSTQLESAEAGGSKTPMRSTHSRASPYVERGYDSETVYKQETSDVHREWMRRADEFGGDSDAFASATSSPAYNNSRSNDASEWTQRERRYQVPFYPASPSPSSAYEYGYSSPFHGSRASASDKSYYHHHQPNQFNQKDRQGCFQESSSAYPSSSQSQLHDPRYHNLYSYATSHRSVHSERSYQADTAHQNRSTYSEHPKSGTSREKRDKKKYVKKRNHVVKRYVLPSAGGAPFATCSYCLELLQLPQVSLHGKKHKGYYQVRCGSCSGVLKFSVREKAHTVLEETVTNHHQDSASEEGGVEIYPNDSHLLSCSDNGSGDRICRSNDGVILSKEEIMRISNTFSDSKVEALQPKVREQQQQPASSECEGDTSRNHFEQSEEACSEKSTEMDNNIYSERVSCGLEEAGLYDKNELVKPESIFGDGSGEALEVPVYKNERMSGSSVEAETVADEPVSHSGEPNGYVCETRVLSENTGDNQECGWEESHENEEYVGEGKWEDITGDKPGLVLEKSRYIGDSICDSRSRNGEAYEDTTVKEVTDHISSNQRFIGHPDQSGEATVTTARTHEEDENLSDTAINDNVRYELEESRYKTSKALETDKVSEDGSVVSLTKASETFSTGIEGETGEERSVSHQMDPANENVEDSYERLEYAGERTWEEETLEDRAGLHLEEYERAPTFHEYEAEEDADGRLESSSSRGSSSDHESSEEESAVFQESQDAKSDQSQTEYEIPTERPELSNTVFDTVTPSEQAKMVGDGSGVSKASETNTGEASEERSVPENESLEISYGTVEQVYVEEYVSDRTWEEAMEAGAGLQLEECHNSPHDWTSERAPTFRLHESELGTMPASEEDANGRSSGSTDSTNDHVSSEEKAVAHEEPSLVDENKFDELLVEDGPSLHLDKCGNDSTILEETFEWTSERAPTFRLHESELGTMLEPDVDADGRSESSSSFNDHVVSRERETDYEEEHRLVTDSRTKAQQVDEVVKDTEPLHLECENESTKLNETFDWTSERALTFRHHEYDELGTMLETPLHLEKCENEKVVLDQTLEPRDDLFRLSLDDKLEQERITFHLEKSQDKQVSLRQTFKQQDDTEENKPASEEDSEAEEDMLGSHLEHLKIENEKPGPTFEPYSHLYNTADPSEIVGLRLALYQTQTSPLGSPMHTPTGSPLHILMRSPIASPMHPHIVSPMRSPINSSGSLSDVLFFAKKS